MKNHKKQLEIMQYHQRWRRGEEDHMKYTAKEVGIAIDYCIDATVELPVARKSAIAMAGEIPGNRRGCTDLRNASSAQIEGEIHRFRESKGKAHGLKK